MAAESRKWTAGAVTHVVAATVSIVATVLVFVAIHMLATYYAASPLLVSAAELAA